MGKLTSGAVKHMFERKGVGKTCESCGHNDWLVLTNFATLILQDSEINGVFSFPVVAIECRNCGNLKFYGRDKLEASR